MPIVSDPSAYAEPTFGQIAEEVVGNLQGYTLTPDMVTYLTADLAVDATTVLISMPEGGCGTGIVEIGDEQVFVTSVDENAGQLNLLPRGRGWRGTTAATHTSGDTVVISPLVPRFRVKQAINDTLNALWPAVYGVGTSEFTWSPGIVLAWEIPAEAERILAVRFKDRYGNWVKVRGWEAVNASNTDSFASGSSLRITETLLSGSTVQVVYAKRPTPFAGDEAAMTDTGLPASCKDLLVAGAMARLVPALDAGRLAVQYVPADELDQPRQLGSATALAREFKKTFDEALAREQADLQNRYPASTHYVSAR